MTAPPVGGGVAQIPVGGYFCGVAPSALRGEPLRRHPAIFLLGAVSLETAFSSFVCTYYVLRFKICVSMLADVAVNVSIRFMDRFSIFMQI